MRCKHELTETVITRVYFTVEFDYFTNGHFTLLKPKTESLTQQQVTREQAVDVQLRHAHRAAGAGLVGDVITLRRQRPLLDTVD